MRIMQKGMSIARAVRLPIGEKTTTLCTCCIIVIYATRFCVNWAFLIAREARLKYERSEDFKDSRAIRKAQFAQKRVAYKILLFETTFLKLPNLLKMISHLLLTVLTKFSRNVTLNVLSRATVGYLLFFALEQLAGSLQRRKMRIYDS
jgi:Na+/H+ antiporter NhaD/arsenite permease-like protein